MKRRVVLSPRAEQHAAEIHAYILENSGEQRADTVVGRLLGACHDLELFPLRGNQRNDIRPGLRVMGFKRYATIAFEVEAERVVIHGILWRGQDVDRLFEDEEK
jgi:toxin ParE1/3/4